MASDALIALDVSGIGACHRFSACRSAIAGIAGVSSSRLVFIQSNDY